MSETQATENQAVVYTAAMLNEKNPLEKQLWSELAIRFRKTKDAEGKEVAPRAPITLFVPILNAEGVADMLAKKNEDGSISKEAQLVIDACASIIHARAKEVTADLLSDNKEVTADSFPIDQCTWEVIANLPPAERGGRGIPEEVWNSFKESYTKFYLEQGLEQKRVETAVAIFVKRLQPAKTNKPLLEKLRTYLAGWFTGANAAEDAGLAEVYQFLDDKIDEFLKFDPSSALDLI